MPTVNDYSWPNDLPEGCPPSDATSADGVFFRFINKNTPSARDFVRPVDRPNANYPPEERCEASAISLFAGADDVTLAQRLIPGFKKKKVAQGKLSPRMGVIKNTPMDYEGTRFESHHDWWMTAEYTDVPPFALVTP